MSRIESLQALLSGGRDDALLRFSLGNEYLQGGDARAAVKHLRLAVRHDPAFSAAWKLLGRALVDTGDTEAAAEAYERGIAAAEARGDVQAAKEMRVFLKRLKR